MGRVRLSALLLSAIPAVPGSAALAQEPPHFSPKGQMPSKYTIEAQDHQRKILPFADKQDFEESQARLYRSAYLPPDHERPGRGGVGYGQLEISAEWERLQQHSSFAAAPSHT